MRMRMRMRRRMRRREEEEGRGTLHASQPLTALICRIGISIRRGVFEIRQSRLWDGRQFKQESEDERVRE
jgi:hypothetical protein